MNQAYRNVRALSNLHLDLPCKEMALYLLGKVLVRRLQDGKILRGKIVETECYLGGEDKASHSFNGRKTPSNEPMFMNSGTCYVYMTYGMYYCFNISSREPGAAVLLRALEPLDGLEEMHNFRKKKLKSSSTKRLKDTDLCNGPAKLCISFDIRKDNCNKLDLSENDYLWLELGDSDEEQIVVTSTRIGIASVGEEWSQKPLRFYLFRNPHVSKRDKKAEATLLENPT